MSYVNTENKAYQQLNNWQKWLVHFSQSALTKFIYQLFLLTDLISLTNSVGLFRIELINKISQYPTILPLGLTYLLIMQFGWLFSWYAMVNHEKQRPIYFKWIYRWLIITVLLVIAGIILSFSTISFNNKILYTSLCFFIGWLGYEIVTVLLHLKVQIEVPQIVKTNKLTFLTKIRKDNAHERSYIEPEYSDNVEFYRNNGYIINNNDLSLLFYKIRRILIIAYTIVIFVTIISLLLQPNMKLGFSVALAIIVIVMRVIYQRNYIDAKECSIYYSKDRVINCSKEHILGIKGKQVYFLDACSLKTDWSDVKYRNRNQHDTVTEKTSHQLHLIFNGQVAHNIYAFSLNIILYIYLLNFGFMIIDSASAISNQIIKLINFQILGYSLGILTIIAIVVTLCYLEYAYLCRQK